MTTFSTSSAAPTTTPSRAASACRSSSSSHRGCRRTSCTKSGRSPTTRRRVRWRSRPSTICLSDARDLGRPPFSVPFPRSIPCSPSGLVLIHCRHFSAGKLDHEQFSVAMFLIEAAVAGHGIPDKLPAALVPPSQRVWDDVMK